MSENIDRFSQVSNVRIQTDAIIDHINELRGYEAIKHVDELGKISADDLEQVLTEIVQRLISDRVYAIVNKKTIQHIVVCYSFMLDIGLRENLTKRELNILKLRDHEQYQRLVRFFFL